VQSTQQTSLLDTWPRQTALSRAGAISFEKSQLRQNAPVEVEAKLGVSFVESVMVQSSNIGWAYDPEILTTMGNAFDHACDCLPVQFRDSDSLRRKLALHIIREINDGESDPTHLAHSAIFSLLLW
jgi:hypothetical protein